MQNLREDEFARLKYQRFVLQYLHYILKLYGSETLINFLITLLCIAFSKNVLAFVYFSFEWIFIYNYHKFRIKEVVVSGNESFQKKIIKCKLKITSLPLISVK